MTHFGQSWPKVLSLLGFRKAVPGSGGAGADDITTGLGADVLVLAASGDSAAATVIGSTFADITEGAGDVVTGDISDTFVLGAGAGAYAARTSGSVFDDSINFSAPDLNKLDVFVYQDRDNGNFYLNNGRAKP